MWLSDGIIRKAHRGKSLTKEDKQLSETRYLAEQAFDTLYQKFGCKRVCYFGLRKVWAQSHLKAVCLNLLKAATGLLPGKQEITF
ncbi:transposase [Neisseria iguanae]|uniref:transposase n=1 Tax=Neisseria iguanae TaxID=90242 RepID=UPI003CCBD6F8